jgi:Tfp pilus assembly protein PilP
MMRLHVIAGLAGGVLMLWLTGGTGVVGSWSAEVSKVSQAATPEGAGAPEAAATPLVFPAASQSYRNRTVGKPDPFRPFVETDLEQKIKKEEGLNKKGGVKSRPLSPLQQREVGQFRLVGIAGDDKRRTAVVEDGTAKKIYPLLVGTYIGPNEGRVVEILPDRVIVEERVEDQTARAKKMQVRRVTMRLHKEE